MKNVVAISLSLLVAFSTAAYAEAVYVSCTVQDGEEKKSVEYLVDTAAELSNFMGTDVSSWALDGTRLVATTIRNGQIIMDNATNSFRLDGDLFDKERVSCNWEIAGTTAAAPNDDAMLAITKKLDKLEERISILEAK